MLHLPTRAWLWAPLLLLALAGSAWLYLQANQAKNLADPARARRQGRPIPVRTAHVLEAEIDQVIGGTAITTPSEQAAIRIDFSVRKADAPPADLVLEAIHVQEGDRVQKGQLLFELEDAVFRQIVQQHEANVAAAEKILQAREVAVEDLRELSHVQRRLQQRGATGLLEVVQTQVLFVQAQTDLAEAEQLLKVAKVELAVARRRVTRCQIKSPLDGFISLAEPVLPRQTPAKQTGNRIALVPGMFLERTSVLAHVLKLDPIHVVMDLPQERSGEVFLGQQAEVVLDSFPQQTFHGSVVRILPQANPELRVLPVIIELSNSQDRIKAGISGYVRLHRTRKATVVPTAAIVNQKDRAVVYRVEDSKARLREVRLGPLLQMGQREVKGGLKEGDEVVVFHNFYRHAGSLTKQDSYLQDNDRVDTDWQRWARRE
jgi:membrane fusion protein (multidrug efflux system)